MNEETEFWLVPVIRLQLVDSVCAGGEEETAHGQPAQAGGCHGCHVSRYWAQLTCHWLSWRHGAVSLGQLPVHEHGGHGGVSLLGLCQCWCGPGAGLRGTAGLLAAGPRWLPRRALPCVRPCSSRTSFPVSWPPWARGPGLLSLY